MEQFTDKLNTYDRIGAYFVPQLCAEREEVLLAAYVDGAGRVLKLSLIHIWLIAFAVRCVGLAFGLA